MKREQEKKKVVPELRNPVCLFGAFVYKLVLIFNPVNRKLLFWHCPPVGDAHWGQLLEVAQQKDRLQQGFLPMASDTAWILS